MPLLVGEGPQDDLRVLFVGLYARGQRQEDLEREDLEVYHPINECIPRQLQLPDSHLVPLKELYTAEELKTSRARRIAGRPADLSRKRGTGAAGGCTAIYVQERCAHNTR